MRRSMKNGKWILGAAVGFSLLALTAAYKTYAGPQQCGFWGGGSPIRPVLLISIDGMHAVDYINCSTG